MILEAIFDGQINPADTAVPKTKEYVKVRELIAESILYFEDSLGKEEYEKFERLLDHLTDLQFMKNEEHFRYGFSMGVLMMKEIYEYPEFLKNRL